MPIFEYVCKACDHQFEALVYGKRRRNAQNATVRAGAAAFGICGEREG